MLAAQRLIEREPYILDSTCFHCQQAVEKYLKAYLIFKEVNFKKTHDIDYLLEECAKFDKEFNHIDVKNINDFAVDIRYPDDSTMQELEVATEYIQIAKHVKQLVESKIILA